MARTSPARTRACRCPPHRARPPGARCDRRSAARTRYARRARSARGRPRAPPGAPSRPTGAGGRGRARRKATLRPAPGSRYRMTSLSTALFALAIAVLPSAAAAQDWTTYGGDATHTNFNPREHRLGPPQAKKLHLTWKVKLNGVI